MSIFSQQQFCGTDSQDRSGDGFYLVSVDNCSEVSEIIAIGENGISIK